jgi:hypothetical protein
MVVGCSTDDKGKDEGKDESNVRKTFEALQTALKNKDAEKIWSLLDSDSQADAEARAKTIRADYEKADNKERKKLEDQLGLPGTELSSLKGKGFLKTKRFLGKYDEIPLSGTKITKIIVQAKKAEVKYDEPDGDHETLSLVRQEGQWKVVLAMPMA